MQPTIEELEKNYNTMRDDQILSLLGEEGMRPEALAILKKIKKQRKINDTPTDKQVTPEKKKLTGIGGWLILLTAGLIIQFLMGLSSLIDIREMLRSNENSLPSLHFMYYYGIILCIYIFIVLVSLLSESKRFPKLFISLLLISIISNVLVFSPTQDYGFIQSIISFIIWGLYIKKSVRVKNTFIK